MLFYGPPGTGNFLKLHTKHLFVCVYVCVNSAWKTICVNLLEIILRMIGKTTTILAAAKKLFGANSQSMVLTLNASDDRVISTSMHAHYIHSKLPLASAGYELSCRNNFISNH